MTEKELLLRQTKDAYDWLNRFTASVPSEKWDIMPATLETHMAWQTGHLVISIYFHSVMVIRGHQMDILQKISMKEYSGLFHFVPASLSLGKVLPADLLTHLAVIQKKSLEVIESLSEDELNSPLEPTPMKHPVANTKIEAIDWNIKHTMYHCGQIAILKRVVDERYDFGLRQV